MGVLGTEDRSQQRRGRKVGKLIRWIEEEEAGQGVIDFYVGGVEEKERKGTGGVQGWMIGWVGRRRRIGM